MIKPYRSVVAILMVGHVTWFFFPWSISYSESALVAARLDSEDALMDLALLHSLGYLIALVYLIAYFGMLFFVDWARKLFAFLLIAGSALIPVHGLSVQSGIEGMIGYLLTLGDGVLLGLSFFSVVDRKFSNI